MKTINNQFYTNSYEKHGVSAKGVHWNSKESQYLRFEIITTFLKDLENSSIIDVGCGFGEYLNFLDTKNLKPDIYLGIDCEDFLINIAKEQFPKNIFLKCDFLKQEIPNADYLVCSGSFNIFSSKDFIKGIENCFKASKKGFIFNFLSKEESIHRLDFTEILDFCKTLTNKVTIKDNYLDNDITFFLEK